jgi:predicted nucleic acid-binding protein
MVFLDASITIFYVEQPPDWGPVATSRIRELSIDNPKIAVSELVRMECLVGPLQQQNVRLLVRYGRFFGSPHVHMQSITSELCFQAAKIRAEHGFKAIDALHLATAMSCQCSRFLTGDQRLANFPELTVEVLSLLSSP